MAWRAELKRRRWYCINGFNMVGWYSDLLYDEWWNSLTQEQQQRVIERRKQRRLQEERETRTAIMKLLSINTVLAGINSPNWR